MTRIPRTLSHLSVPLQGAVLEKTQEEKIAREPELLAELCAIEEAEKEGGETDPPTAIPLSLDGDF